MRIRNTVPWAVLPAILVLGAGCGRGNDAALRSPSFESDSAGHVLALPLTDGVLRVDGIYFETEQGRTTLPPEIPGGYAGETLEGSVALPDGRTVTVSVRLEDGIHYGVQLSAEPSEDILRWGFALESAPAEYYTGVMERVVDGAQEASWAPEITEALDLRGQRIEMLVKPTTSVYAPFFLSSRGYALFFRTYWPGLYDFARTGFHARAGAA